MPKPVKRDFSTEDWEAYYRRYQETLADEFLIPILSRWDVRLENRRVLEVGCGNGGCGAAFHKRGADVVMMDIDERLVSLARELNAKEKTGTEVFAGDVMDDGADFYERGPFDLVIFRDVIEHIERPAEALSIVRGRLSGDGRVFVVFPPYYSPYGAHQQILPRKRLLFLPYNKLPYLQILPRPVFAWLTRGDDPASREVARLSGIRLTLGGFERCVKEADLRVERSRFFLSRPTFALRYGIPVVGAGPLGRVPLLREMLVTAGYYLLSKR